MLVEVLHASLEFHIKLASVTPVMKKDRTIQALPRSWSVCARAVREDDRISEPEKTVQR